MKIVIGLLYLLAIVWGLVFLAFTYSSIQEEAVTSIIARKSNRKESEFIPSIQYLRAYQQKHNKLPTREEFHSWSQKTFDGYFNQEYSLLNDFEGIPEISNIPSNLKKDKEFVVCQWNGEEYDYYTSWNNHYSLDDFENDTGRLYYLYSFLIGILPLTVLLFLNWLYKQQQTQPPTPG